MLNLMFMIINININIYIIVEHFFMMIYFQGITIRADIHDYLEYRINYDKCRPKRNIVFGS